MGIPFFSFKSLIKSDAKELLDSLYPIGSHFICLSANDLPKVGQWALDDSYNGKALWVDNTQTPGTALSGSLPNITGTCGYWVKGGDSSSGAMYNIDNGEINKYGSTGVYPYSSVGFQASRSNSVYSASAGTNVVRPTSITVQVYVRTG